MEKVVNITNCSHLDSVFTCSHYYLRLGVVRGVWGYGRGGVWGFTMPSALKSELMALRTLTNKLFIQPSIKEQDLL